MIHIVLILKGFLIGIAKVIPGVSGSLVAVSMGLYEKGIEAISHPFRCFKENLIFLGNVGFGILLAIAFGSGIIEYFLLHFPLFTTLLFVGFIVGTFPSFYHDVQIHSMKDIMVIVLIAIIFVVMLNIDSNSKFVYTNSIMNNLLVFCFGMIDAATMVIPGISGTAIFMILGCYPFILRLFSSTLDGTLFTETFIPFLFFGLGLLFGTIAVSKFMSYAFKKYYRKTYLCIFGFALSSVLILLLDIISTSPSLIDIFIGTIFAIFGGFLSFWLNKKT